MRDSLLLIPSATKDQSHKISVENVHGRGESLPRRCSYECSRLGSIVFVKGWYASTTWRVLRARRWTQATRMHSYRLCFEKASIGLIKTSMIQFWTAPSVPSNATLPRINQRWYQPLMQPLLLKFLLESAPRTSSSKNLRSTQGKQPNRRNNLQPNK